MNFRPSLSLFLLLPWLTGLTYGESGYTSSPLSAPASGGQEKRFTSIPSSQSGVTGVNRYEDPRMWNELYQELVYGAIGSGVAVGDFNGDGKPDLFVANKSDPCRLYRNEGGWRFTDVTDQALVWPSDGAWVQGVSWADVDNDGWLDLYVCRFDAPNLLFINQRNGTFREEGAARGLAMRDASGMASFADYDRDGWLDVYVQTNMLQAAKEAEGQPDRLFRNVGGGRFEDVTEKAGIRGRTLGHAATWWDYDEDGWPDLYVSNDYAVPDRLYRNQRDGTFADVATQVLPTQPYYSMGADFADVNNDGHLDFLATDMAATTAEKDQRGMAGSRARAQLAPRATGEATQLMRNHLYLNEGQGLMREAAWQMGLAATDWTWSPRFEDFDLDGFVDLVVTNGMIREYHNADLLQRIMGLESQSGSRQVMRTSPLLADRDLAFRNEDGLHFARTEDVWALSDEGVSFGSATGDFDGDGAPDLVRIRYQDTAELLRNGVGSGHRLVVELRGRRSNSFGLGATVRLHAGGRVQTRTLFPTRGYLSSSEPVLFFGLGTAEKVDRLEIHWPNGGRQELTNLPVDRRIRIQEPDTFIAATPALPPARGVTTAAGTPSAATPPASEPGAQPFLPWHFHTRGPALAWQPQLTENDPVFATGGTRQTPLRVWQKGQKIAELPLDTGLDDGPIAWIDADRDGDLDLLVTKLGTLKPAGSTAYQPQLWLNDGQDHFARSTNLSLPAFAQSVGALALADVNRDGFVDLFFGGRNLPGRYPLPARSALWLGGPNGWTDASASLPGQGAEVGLVTSAVWTDLNQDGRLDLLLTLEVGTIQAWVQTQSGQWEEQGEQLGFASAGPGFWSAIAVADFNHDGRPDYAVGNLGRNTPYQGTAEAPDLFLWGDFKEGGTPLLIEGFTEEGQLKPRRTRNELTNRIPAVAKRFPANDTFAKSALPEILSPEKFKSARRWNIGETRSGVFLSSPAGTWHFSPLPAAAQASPVQGLVATDLNGDGHADLALAQNFSGGIAALGPFSGGLGVILLGDGRGGFRALSPAESGWIALGEGRALSVVPNESGDRPDLWLTRAGANGLHWQNQGRTEGVSLALSVLGPIEHVAGLRAVYRQPMLPDQTVELSPNSGYQTQHLPVLFFGRGAAAGDGEIELLWPNGRKQRIPVPAATTRLSVSAKP